MTDKRTVETCLLKPSVIFRGSNPRVSLNHVDPNCDWETKDVKDHYSYGRKSKHLPKESLKSISRAFFGQTILSAFVNDEGQLPRQKCIGDVAINFK